MNQELFVDTLRDQVAKAEGKIQYGWEITDENGDVVDSKYGYTHFTQAARMGQRMLRKISHDLKVAA